MLYGQEEDTSEAYKNHPVVENLLEPGNMHNYICDEYHMLGNSIPQGMKLAKTPKQQALWHALMSVLDMRDVDAFSAQGQKIACDGEAWETCMAFMLIT